MPSEEDPIEAEKREKIPPWGLPRSLLVLHLRPALALSWERAGQQIQKKNTNKYIREPVKNVLADFARKWGGGTPPFR